ncbi:hypothetical protein CPT06_05930 [Bacillus vallismortis]|nr:hypothetical protein CPT06_05930 [Bacillus vallismortis]
MCLISSNIFSQNQLHQRLEGDSLYLKTIYMKHYRFGTEGTNKIIFSQIVIARRPFRVSEKRMTTVDKNSAYPMAIEQWNKDKSMQRRQLKHLKMTIIFLF